MSETNNTQERGLRKTRIGVVVSDKMDKTVTIQIKTRVRHPLYGKIMNQTSKSRFMTKTMSAASAIPSADGNSSAVPRQALAPGRNHREGQVIPLSCKEEKPYDSAANPA